MPWYFPADRMPRWSERRAFTILGGASLAFWLLSAAAIGRIAF
jgi:hypothetical protein